ncbi:L-threonine-O-3-phosphate decarboxylase [Methanospirillum lacunae]|uniref:L-threonine-O-3-phosphate decarboxylase n=1 Tax=Methanospirillum lacunae TaxID=668570 RepID=A0A2V2N7D0_9EURY|nr:L-threonine-O-3-phosphate decarboxylase [Methanospirillum lacunae]
MNKAVHGGKGVEIKSHEKKQIFDYSTSLNPMPPKLTWDVSIDAIRDYPDDQYTHLKETIAHHHGRKPEEICVGNGSAEVIRTLCHTMLNAGSVVEVSPHTFSEYALSSKLAGAEVTEKRSARVDLSFVCNPDNPSGVLTPRDEILERLNDIKGRGGILCVDEAFIDLADPHESVSDIQDCGLFVLCSLTKSFSMAGVRFGYGIGDPDLIAAMEVMRPPWTINAFAEAMALQAFDLFKDLELSRAYIAEERARICKEAIRLGLNPSQASANYVLLDIGSDSKEFTTAMFNQGILVRDCRSFGFPTCIRVAIRDHETNNRLLEALSICLR